MLQIMIYLWLLVSSLSLGYRPSDAIRQEVSTIDFGARTGWHTRGSINVRDDGRISLTQDGVGLVWKSVEVDVDQFPVMLVRVAQSIRRERWIVAVERNDSPSLDRNKWTRLIERYAEESGFIVPLKKITGWSGKVRFVLMIAIEGRNRDWVEFDALEAIHLSDARPVPPKLSVPSNGSVISPLAVHFTWFQSANALEYELQTSSRGDFSESQSIKVVPPYPADKLPYLPEPEDLLPPGKWFWRVRAFNIDAHPGEWSETNTFSVREAVAPKPPELSVSTDHPLIILFADAEHLVENWKAVPDELKPYVVFRTEVLPSENFRPLLRTAQENRIPVLIQTSGPHDYYGRTSSRISLSEVEQFFKEYSVLKGVYICEQAFRDSPTNNRIMVHYAERLITLAAEYGKTVVWADGHWGRNLWIDVGLKKKLLETIRQHRRYFIPLWKMNGSMTAYSVHDALFGLWVSEAVDNWGVQPERWYWYEAGFRKLNEQGWFKEGNTEDFPPSIYGQMMLLGLSSGASVYAFEPGGDIWGKDAGLSEISRTITFPLLLEMIRHQWIPSREQVLRKIHTAYVADRPDSAWSMDYGSMHALYEGTYGIQHPFQMIPSRSRYFWIPILPKWTPQRTLEIFPNRVRAQTFSTSGEATRYFDTRYASSDKGNAWVVHYGDRVLIMNSRENWDEDQTFDVPLGGSVNRISGLISVNSYLIVEQAQDKCRIHLNGRPERHQVLELWGLEKPPKVVATPQRALAKSSWGERNHCLVLDFSLRQGAVSVEIGF